MSEVFAQRDDARTRAVSGPGDAHIATVYAGGQWPPDYRVTCHWKGGTQATAGRYESQKAAAQAARRAWVAAGCPAVSPPTG